MHEFVDIKCIFPWRWFWILSDQALDRRDIMIHYKEVHCIHKSPKFYRESILAYFLISIFEKIVSFENSASEWIILPGKGRTFKKILVKTFSQCSEKLCESFLWTGRSLINSSGMYFSPMWRNLIWGQVLTEEARVWAFGFPTRQWEDMLRLWQVSLYIVYAAIP